MAGLRASYIIILILSIYLIAGDAQTANELGNTNASNPSGEPNQEEETSNEKISREQMVLSLGVLAFGMVLIVFLGVISSKKVPGWDYNVTQIFTISLIVTAGLFLITSGNANQQNAPMFTLLGCIVGYLFGKSPQGSQSSKPGP